MKYQKITHTVRAGINTDGEYGSVKLIIRGESGEGAYHFTVILYGDEGLSIEMGGMKPTSGAVVELVEKANAA